MVLGDALAMPPGTDASTLTRYLNQVHDDFVQTGQVDHALRRVVVDSWRRSVGSGLDPEYSRPQIRLNAAQLAEIWATHPLAAAMPMIRRLLVDSAAEAGLLVAVSDAAGQLLWVEGDYGLRTRAEGMHFMPGADWSEASAGTNAPDTALAVALSAHEHSAVTIRAELTRLRAAWGPIGLSSRPYAVQTPIALDLRDVRTELDRANIRRAVELYRGPVLPQSLAPAVEELREDLHQALRSRLIAAGEADSLLAFADTAHGHDDYEIWQAASAALPESSPRQAEVETCLRLLDAALA